jgi:hypothetical protein
MFFRLLYLVLVRLVSWRVLLPLVDTHPQLSD